MFNWIPVKLSANHAEKMEAKNTNQVSSECLPAFDEDRIFVAKLNFFLIFVFWLHGQQSPAFSACHRGFRQVC
jgi:hypothetical protein